MPVQDGSSDIVLADGSKLSDSSLSADQPKHSRAAASWKAFQRIAHWVATLSKNTLSFTFALIGIAAVIWLGILLVQAITSRSISIAEIAAPKDLADRGYTSTVAAVRLRDALDSYTRETKTKMRTATLSLSGDEPNIVVPTLGLPLDYVADVTARGLHIDNRNRLSGEFTETQGKLSLRLRLNDRVIFDDTVPAPPTLAFKSADALLSEAASAIFQQTEPYVVAAHFGRLHQDNRAFQAAEAIIAGNLSKTDENVIMAHVLLGNVYDDRRNYGRALAEYAETIQLDPRRAVAYYDTGLVYSEERKTDLAIKEYDQAIRWDPTYSWPHDNLGSIYSGMLRYGDAIREYETAMHLDPTDDTAHRGLGMVYEDENDRANAIAELKNAVALDRNDARNFVSLGDFYEDAENHNKAVQEYKRAIQLDPTDASAQNDLGHAYEDEGMHGAAFQAYEAAIRIDPAWAVPYNGLGNVFLDEGKLDLAIREYRTSIQHDPQYAYPYHNLGRAFAGKGRMTLANAEWAKAHQLDGTRF